MKTGVLITATEKQKQLIEENHNLIYSFCSKKGLNIDEWYDVAAIGLTKAGINYTPDRGVKFSTYAYSVMDNERKRVLKQKFSNADKINAEVLYYNNPLLNGVNDEITFLDTCANPGSSMENEVITKVMYDNFLSTLDNKQKQILKMYEAGYNQREISEQVGCSMSNPHMAQKSSKEKWLKYQNKI